MDTNRPSPEPSLPCAVNKEPESTHSSCEGCHIINLGTLEGFVQEISSHSSTCHQGMVYLVGESHRSGMASILSARCSGCCLEIAFPTSSKVSGLSGSQRWEVNLATASGQMATGGGYAPLQEQMSILGILVMTGKLFTSTGKVLGKWWSEVMHKSMHNAVAEEKK